MSGRMDERGVETLRRRAERAMDEGRGRRVVEPILQRILKLAPEGDPCRVFAHRHLAELHLEEDPWAAALHLRKVIGAKPHDDVSHSLMALAQALLGNYRAAVSSYRRALALEPRNPWYHHNLGHLLDVALDQPYAALKHLEAAFTHADPPEHEITASVAHCLARVDRLSDARQLAEEATIAAPESDDHRALLAWIEAGAPADVPVHEHKTSSSRGGPRESSSSRGGARESSSSRGGARESSSSRVSSSSRESSPRERASQTARTEPNEREKDAHAAVRQLLAEALQIGRFSSDQIEAAYEIWTDYAGERGVGTKRAEVCAAAVHLALLLVYDVCGVSKATVAQAYGVSPTAVSTRFADLQRALDLRRHDPRYA